MQKRHIALGFYQEQSVVHAVVSELKRKNFSRFAKVHYKHDHTLEIQRYFPVSALFFSWVFIALIFSLIFFNAFFVRHVSSTFFFTGMVVLFAIGSIYAYWCFSRVIDVSIINRFKGRVIIDETLIIVHVKDSDVREVLEILRQVKNGHPVTFLLRSALFVQERTIDLPSEPLTMESLQQEATKLAISLEHTAFNHSKKPCLIARIKKSNKTLQLLRHDIADAEYIEQTIPSSAEWLLDNMYVIEGCIEDVKLNLPKNYHKILPKTLTGPLAGFPRIYVLATELVKNCAGQLNRKNITNFLHSYQIHHSLTIGELWAFPLMLRLRLIEWVEFLAVRVDNRMREFELAGFWGNRLLYAARYEPSKLPIFLADLAVDQTSFSGHFAEELLDHLFDEDSILPMVKEWLEGHFGSPLEKILHQEHLDETSEQLIFANSMRSLIALSQLSWLEIFESVSPVDAILRQDLNGIYSKMDFTTRNCYRERIEKIARRVHLDELEVAKKALDLAHHGVKEFEQHIGYYLIDEGLQALEKTVDYHPLFSQRFHRWILKHPSAVYLGGLLLITFGFEFSIFSILSKAHCTSFQMVIFLALSLLPGTMLS